MYLNNWTFTCKLRTTAAAYLSISYKNCTWNTAFRNNTLTFKKLKCFTLYEFKGQHQPWPCQPRDVEETADVAKQTNTQYLKYKIQPIINLQLALFYNNIITYAQERMNRKRLL